MLTLVNAGKIQHRDFTVDQSCPSWLAEKVAGTGAISYGATGATFETLAAADRAYLVNTNNSLIPKNTPHVIRVKAQITADVNNNMIFPILVVNAATTPTGSISVSSAYVYPRVDFYRSSTGRIFEAAYLSSTGGLTAAYSLATDYCFSVTRGTADTQLHVYSNNYAALLDTSVAWANLAFPNYPWLCIGDVSSAYYGTMVVAYVQLMRSTDITVTGLPTGGAVRLYNSAGTLLSSAVSVGGTATLDARNCDFASNPDKSAGGFKGYVNVYSDATYATLVDSCSSESFWGGANYLWTAPVPPTPPSVPLARERRRTRKPLIKVFDCTGANLLKVISDYKDLSFETDLSSGYSIADFAIGRNPLKIYSETEPFNQIVITDGAETCWEGFIDEPRGDADGNLEMACVGWVSHLNRNPCKVNQAPQTMATFIGSTMLADTAVNLYIVLGNTTWPAGYTQYTAPAQEDLAPGGKFYTEILDAYAKYGGTDVGAAVIGGRWMIWAKKAIYYQPVKTTPDWIIRASECPGFSCTSSPKNYWNRVHYSYSPTGSEKIPGMVEDTVSQQRYGGRVVSIIFDIPGRCSPTDALQAATVKLNEGSSMVIVGQFTVRNLYDARTLVKVDSWLAKAGDLMTAMDLKTGLGTLATRQTANVITTFEVKNTKYTPKTRENAITPVNDDVNLAASLAIFERRTAMT